MVMINIICDNDRFIISEKSLSGSILLTKIYNHDTTHERIYCSTLDDKIHIDIDPTNLKMIVKFLRGYDIHDEIRSLTEIGKQNLLMDATLLQIPNLLEKIGIIQMQGGGNTATSEITVRLGIGDDMENDNIRINNNEDNISNYNIDTSIFFSDNSYEINKLINTIQDKLQSEDAFSFINNFSTDPNVANLIKQHNAIITENNDTDSDLDYNYNPSSGHSSENKTCEK